LYHPQHVTVRSFHAKWKLDLYCQLRTQEICGRIQRGGELALTNGISVNVNDAVYGSR
jgi:hypothetical protein